MGDPWTRGGRRRPALKLTVLAGLPDVLATAARGSRPPCAGPPAPASSTPRSGRRRPTAAARCAAARGVPRAGGSAVVLDAPAVKAAVDVWGPVPALELMRRVKEQFDPGAGSRPAASWEASR